MELLNKLQNIKFTTKEYKRFIRIFVDGFYVGIVHKKNNKFKAECFGFIDENEKTDINDALTVIKAKTFEFLNNLIVKHELSYKYDIYEEIDKLVEENLEN